MRYSEKILDLFFHPLHAGQLAENKKNVFYARGGYAGETDVVDFYMEVNAGKITEVRFQASGLPTLIACAEYAAQRLVGVEAQEIDITSQQLIKDLELPELRKSSALIVQEALENLREKYVSHTSS